VAGKDPIIKVRTSRLWALFHGNFTRLVFPERMILDDSGVTFKSVSRWYTPWKYIDEKVFFSSIADEKLSPNFLLASIEVVNTSGSDSLNLPHVWRWPAKRFVNEARKRKGKS
jgi:hypothetical protein